MLLGWRKTSLLNVSLVALLLFVSTRYQSVWELSVLNPVTQNLGCSYVFTCKLKDFTLRGMTFPCSLHVWTCKRVKIHDESMMCWAFWSLKNFCKSCVQYFSAWNQSCSWIESLPQVKMFKYLEFSLRRAGKNINLEASLKKMTVMLIKELSLKSNLCLRGAR